MEECYADNGEMRGQGIADHRDGGVDAHGQCAETRGEQDNQNGERHGLDIRSGEVGGGGEANDIARDGENDVEEYYIASGGEPSSEDGETSDSNSAEECFVEHGANGEQGETSATLGFEVEDSNVHDCDVRVQGIAVQDGEVQCCGAQDSEVQGAMCRAAM